MDKLYKLAAPCIINDFDYSLENMTVSMDIEGGVRKRIKIEGSLLVFGNSYEELLDYKRNNVFELDSSLLKRTIVNEVEAYRPYLNIKLNLLSGTWNDEQKTCKINCAVIDTYETVESYWDDEIKVSTTDLTPVLMSDTSYEDRYYFDDVAGLAYDDDAIAALCYRAFQETGYYWAFRGKSDNWDGGILTRYFFIREVISMKYPGWLIDKDGRYYSLDINNISLPVTVTQSYDYYTTLKSALEKLVFGKNLTVPEDWCTIITAKNIGKILMFPKSNLKRPDASDPAVYFKMSLKEFIEMMKGFFNCEYFIINGQIKFRHPSEISHSGEFDTTNFKGVNWSTYDYDEGDYIQKRTWTFEDSHNFSSYTAFYGTVKSGEESYELSKFNNDILYLLDNPDAANDEGFSLVAVDSNNKVIKSYNNEVPLFNANMHGSTIKSKFFNEIEKESKVADFSIPIENILSLDPTVYYKTNVSENTILQSAKQQLDCSFAKLKCVKQ